MDRNTAGRWMCGFAPRSPRALGEQRRRQSVRHDTLDAGCSRRACESGAQTIAAPIAAGAQGPFRRARAARWQFPPVVRGARSARLLDESRGRCDRPDAGAARGRGNDLGGGRRVAAVDRRVRGPAGALCGMEKCLRPGAECAGAGHRDGPADAAWPDVRRPDSDHRRAPCGPRVASSAPLDPSGSPGEETAATQIARRVRECFLGARISEHNTRSHRRRRRPRTFIDGHRVGLRSIAPFSSRRRACCPTIG